jgi:hypothetical protein
MSSRRHRVAEAEQRIERLIAISQRHARPRHRLRRRAGMNKWVRAWLLGMLVLFVLVPGFALGGWMLGVRFLTLLLGSPLLLAASWIAILYYTLLHKPAPPKLEADSSVSQLPEQTGAWLDAQRKALPYAADSCIDAILNQLDALTPQLSALDAKSPGAHEARRLLAEELPELVRGYQKVPRALAQQASDAGPSPDRQLIEGLGTIKDQLGRLHERLAATDLHALATHHRYLELKYKNDADKLE